MIAKRGESFKAPEWATGYEVRHGVDNNERTFTHWVECRFLAEDHEPYVVAGYETVYQGVARLVVDGRQYFAVTEYFVGSFPTEQVLVFEEEKGRLLKEDIDA